MTQPIKTSIDHEIGAAYVSYREIAPGEATRTERVDFDVRVDYNAAGDLLGIELLAVDEPAVALARDFAAKHDLAFPRDLSGLVPA
jgi:uncharacterized protein YuzE